MDEPVVFGSIIGDGGEKHGGKKRAVIVESAHKKRTEIGHRAMKL